MTEKVIKLVFGGVHIALIKEVLYTTYLLGFVLVAYIIFAVIVSNIEFRNLKKEEMRYIKYRG